LIFLPSIWKHIVERVPAATLTITGDWSLWSGNDYTNEVAQYRRAFAGMKNVTYLSAVRRSELIKIQSETEYFLYPHVSENPELFCISLAEAQVAGAVPITSRVGAIETTNRFGYKIDGHPQDQEFKRNFIDKTVSLMQNNLIDISDKAKLEFGSERILERWNEIFSS
jgi:glycosyltransferase involved in cell wall biosynthesis